MRKNVKKITTNNFEEERKVALLVFLRQLIKRLVSGKVVVVTWGTWSSGVQGNKEFKITFTEKE